MLAVVERGIIDPDAPRAPAERRRGFEDGDAAAGRGERDGRGEAGPPAADNRDRMLTARHLLLPSRANRPRKSSRRSMPWPEA
jgi:hypothetical protein